MATHNAIEHLCSEPDCQHPLDTYIMNGATIGTCRNLDCGLYGVTLEVGKLAALTPEERAAWERGTRRIRAMERQDAQERAAMLQRIPEHLRTIG